MRRDTARLPSADSVNSFAGPSRSEVSVRQSAFVRRHALPSFAVAALLVPVADVVRREVSDAPPSGAQMNLAASATPLALPITAAPRIFDANVALAADGGEATAGASISHEASASTASTVSAALEALAPHVSRMSNPEALRTAFQAYFGYKAARSERVRKPYLYFVDLGLDNRTPRGYVFDMEKMTVVDGPFMVSHGNGSSSGSDGVPTRFSNRAGSKASSLGLYVAQETYGFSGKSGGRHYTSVGLRLDGVSPGFNDAARARGIVAHGAPYVTRARAGRSEGCPAMEPERARRLLPLIADGGLVFIYSPNDARWLEADPWVQG
jgi:hypothetical protein